MKMNKIKSGPKRLALVVFSLMTSTSLAYANPEGGVVTAGQASLISDGKNLNIQQSSQRAVIDWRSFNVGIDETTRFVQPSSQSITVNRVNDANPSKILGNLSANGNIVLINPSGVMFGKESKVDVGGMIATTLDIDNAEFMSGGALSFHKASGANGMVVNEGSITAREAGLVGLVSDSVENSGVIAARMGKVVLASGDKAVIDFQGDGLLSLEVSEESSKRLIRHTGKIRADGGEVLLTASAGRTLVDSLIEVKGEIEAPTIGRRNGKIVISAAGKNRTSKNGAGAKIVVDSTLAARGKESGQSGGDIRVLGDNIQIGKNARILTDGDAAGGAINIGGSFQGGWDGADYALLSVRRPELEDLQAAELVWVEAGAEIDASSTGSGNAGDVILWADKGMYYYGASRAKGGAISGNGGLIEVSGKEYLDFNGTADTRAANGVRGRLLLDPTNITISSALSQNSGTGFPYMPTGDDVTSILNVATLEGAMGSNSVTIQTRATGSQAGDINIDAPINADDYDNGYTLTLIAAHDINVNAPVSYAGNGSFDFTAGHDINLNAEISSWYTKYLMAQNDVVVNAPQLSGAYSFQVGRDVILNADVAAVIYMDTLISGTNMSIGSNLHSFNLDATDISHLTSPSRSLYAGNYSSLGNIDLSGNNDWSYLYLKASPGKTINVSGNHHVAGNTELIADGFSFADSLSGEYYFILRNASAGATIGIGDGTGGSIHLSDNILDNIVTGFASYYFGSNNYASSITLGERIWNADVTAASSGGVVTVAGDQTFLGGNHDLDLNSGNGTVIINGAIAGVRDLDISTTNLQINADVSGTGRFYTYAYSSLGVGDGSTGAETLSSAEMNHILDGWSNIILSSNTDISMGTNTWHDNLDINADNISVVGAQNFGANDVSLNSYTSGINIGGTLSGTGNLVLTNASNSTIGLAGAAGTYNLSVAELDNILNGWASVTIGDDSNTGIYTVNSYNWNSNITFLNGSGNMIFNGAQNFAHHDATIKTGRLLDLNAALSGTGEITLMSSFLSGGTIIGATAPTTYFRVSNTDFNTFLLGQGWSSFSIGSEEHSGAISITGTRTWDADVAVKSKGAVTVSAVQSIGNHDFTILTDSDPVINGQISGTGILTVAPITYSDNAKTIGVGSASGVVNINATELSRFLDGWSKLVLGRSDQQGEIYLGSNTFVDPVEVLTGSQVYIEGNQVSTDSSANQNKMTFVAGLSFDNTFGHTINPGAGRYLVYSQDPAMDVLGGLTRDVKRYNKTYAAYAPDSVIESGNAYFYAVSPTLNISIDNANKQYGASNPSFSYTIDSGLIDGDIDADAVSSAALASTATAASDVGHYAITGSFLSDMGYSIVVTNGDLNVTKATLTATANNANRIYGESNPSFGLSYSGFVNGDDVTDIDTLATAGTAAMGGSAVGSYAINGSGAFDNNYNFTYVAGQLSVTPRTLDVLANSQQIFVGQAPQPYTITYRGFVGGDTASNSLLQRAVASDNAPDYGAMGVYQITPYGGASNGNYILNYLSGDLTITAGLPNSVTRVTSLPSHVIELSGLFENRLVQENNMQAAAISDNIRRTENGDVLISLYSKGNGNESLQATDPQGVSITLERRLAKWFGI